MDVSGIVRDDFDASVEANVIQLVAGWTPLLDSSLKGSAVVNASANSSYEEYEVGHSGWCETTERVHFVFSSVIVKNILCCNDLVYHILTDPRCGRRSTG